MLELLQNFFASGQFIPHGHCYLWKPGLVRLHLLSDLSIALAYYSIPIMLVYFVRQRRDVPFSSVFWLFSAFIAACGTTHLMGVWTLWHPAYWLAGMLKAITAIISLYTAWQLFPLIPQALALPSPEQLQLANQRLNEEIAERKQSDLRFRAIFDRTFQFIGLLEPNGTLIEANQTALDFGGLKAEEVIARPFWECYWWKISPKTQAKLREAIALAAKGEFIRYEEDVWGCGDRVTTIDFSLKPIKDENGRVTLIIPEGRDISERKRNEAEIQKLNAELEQRVRERTAELEAAKLETDNYAAKLVLALDAAKMGAWSWDLATNQMETTIHFKQIFDFDQTEEITYEKWRQRLHPEDLLRVETLLQKLLVTKEDYEAQYRIVWSDGSWHWVNALGRFYYDREGSPVRMVGVVVDISDRKQAEIDLHNSEERLRLATEAADLGMWFWDLTDNNLVWTTRCKTLFGIDPDRSMSYELFLSSLHPDDRDRTQKAVIRTLEEKVEYNIEYRTIWPDGSLHWIAAKGRGFYDRGKAVRMMGTAQDITERKQVELQLQEQAKQLRQLNKTLAQTTALLSKQNQELDRFVYVISHDLKAPLRAIANLSTWIEEDLAGQLPEENQKQMQLLRSRVYRMEDMINGLLAYSRVGRSEIPEETIDVGGLIAEVLDSLAPPPTFLIEIKSAMPTIVARRFLLFQVFANLIDNAIKHHEQPNGKIEISATTMGDYYQFAISDDGSGIAPEYHEKIFGIFQVLQPRDRKENTGIGLSIVKKIIETEGGEIVLESELGKGATFRFSWPKQVKNFE